MIHNYKRRTKRENYPKELSGPSNEPSGFSETIILIKKKIGSQYHQLGVDTSSLKMSESTGKDK